MTDVVVWDGRRNGPGGAHLFIPEEVPHEPPSAQQERRTLREQVLGSLRDAPRTLAQLAADTGASTAKVAGVLHACRKVGAICIVRRDATKVQAFGRRWVTVYGVPGGPR